MSVSDGFASGFGGCLGVLFAVALVIVVLVLLGWLG